MIKGYFFLQNIVVTFQNNFKQASIEQNCPKINIFSKHRKKNWMKNVLLLQYLFIAILCAKMSSVYRALHRWASKINKIESLCMEGYCTKRSFARQILEKRPHITRVYCIGKIVLKCFCLYNSLDRKEFKN